MLKSLVYPVLGSLALLVPSSAHPVEERAIAVPAAHHVITGITRTINSRPEARVGDQLRRFRQFAEGEPIGVGSAVVAQHQVEYLLDVTAGGKNYSLIIDTGSSDTWFVKSGFQCVDRYRTVVNSAYCNFGPASMASFAGGQIENQHFNITYGSSSGPFLYGQMGFSDLTIAGLTVPKQQIALATFGAWNGDGISSGILGLGLPALTEAFTGTSSNLDGLQNAITYDPVVTTMSRQIKNSIFSLGLSRKASDSFLAFGGVPSNVVVGNYSSTPILKLNRRTGGSDYFYYTIATERWFFNNTQVSKNTSALQVIVDSGTTLNLLPYDLAKSINDLFTPRATLVPEQGGWFVPCNAKPPSLGIQIGGQVLWTDPTSMILPEVRDPSTGYCASGIGYTDSAPWILGDVFMQGLVNVFDISEKMEMRFAKRL